MLSRLGAAADAGAITFAPSKRARETTVFEYQSRSGK
jgi:hypothetical protein